jgi:hypothetical protein
MSCSFQVGAELRVHGPNEWLANGNRSFGEGCRCWLTVKHRRRLNQQDRHLEQKNQQWGHSCG